MQLISQMDMFGANFYLRVDQESQQLKSIIGGLISITLYGLQFGYLSYYLYIWLENQLLPTIYQTYSQAPNQYMDLQFNSMTISFDNPINPFEKEHNILIPYMGNTNLSNGQYFDLKIVNQTNQKMLFNNITLMANQTDIIKFMNFEICDQNSKNYFNVSCAPQNLIDEFLYINQLFVEFNITLNQYNVKSKRLESYQKIIPLVLDMSVVTNAMLVFKTGTYNIQQGTIFSTTDEIYCLQSLDLIVQNYAQQSYYQRYQSKTPLILSLSLDQQQQQTYIQYPLLGDVLAQVGSIVSLIMLFSYVAQSLNQVYLQNHLTHEIINIYYPQFRKIKLSRNFINKITSIKYENGKYGDENIIKFFSKIEKLAQNKLNILNFIYEISRIQFILQTLQTRDIFVQCHQLGISIPINQKKNNSQKQFKILQPKQQFSTVFPLDESNITNNKSNLQYTNILKQNERQQDQEIDQSNIERNITQTNKQQNSKIFKKSNSEQEKPQYREALKLKKYDIKLISYLRKSDDQ